MSMFINKPKVILSVINKLKQFKAEGFPGEHGLCSCCELGRLGNTIRYEMFQSWEHYSGSNTYPVPAEYGFEASTAFLTSNGNEAMYGDNYYGNMRKNLVDHCIKYLTELTKINDNG